MKNERQKYIVGNWKMNHTINEVRDFVEKLEDEFKGDDKLQIKAPDYNLWIAPQAIHLQWLFDIVPEFLQVGGQNSGPDELGAYTGESSPISLGDVGACFVILGHSERRHIFKESHELLSQKVKVALKNNLKVIFCVGETRSERENNQTEAVLRKQLIESLGDLKNLPENLPKKLEDNLIIAYEPVWAIGTGVVATTDEAQSAHAFIRDLLGSELKLSKQNISILYGGSVKPSNIKSLMDCQDIDGVLVGGASLDSRSYLDLLRHA